MCEYDSHALKKKKKKSSLSMHKTVVYKLLYTFLGTYIHQSKTQTGQRDFVAVQGGEQHGTIHRTLLVGGVGRNVQVHVAECRPSRSKQSLSPEPSRTGSNHTLKCQEISTKTNCFKNGFSLPISYTLEHSAEAATFGGIFQDGAQGPYA